MKKVINQDSAVFTKSVISEKFYGARFRTTSQEKGFVRLDRGANSYGLYAIEGFTHSNEYSAMRNHYQTSCLELFINHILNTCDVFEFDSLSELAQWLES